MLYEFVIAAPADAMALPKHASKAAALTGMPIDVMLICFQSFNVKFIYIYNATPPGLKCAASHCHSMTATMLIFDIYAIICWPRQLSKEIAQHFHTATMPSAQTLSFSLLTDLLHTMS